MNCESKFLFLFVGTIKIHSLHLTFTMYLSILQSHLHRTSISLLVNVHVSAPYSRADLMQTSCTLPLVLSPVLWFTNKLAITHHLFHLLLSLAWPYAPDGTMRMNDDDDSHLHYSLHSFFTVQHISQIANLFYFSQHAPIYYQPGTLVIMMILMIKLMLMTIIIMMLITMMTIIIIFI